MPRHHRSRDEPIPISSRYLVTVRRAIGIPRSVIKRASSSSLRRRFGFSEAINSRNTSFTLNEPLKKSESGIRRPLGSKAYLLAVARLIVHNQFGYLAQRLPATMHALDEETRPLVLRAYIALEFFI